MPVAIACFDCLEASQILPLFCAFVSLAAHSFSVHVITIREIPRSVDVCRELHVCSVFRFPSRPLAFKSGLSEERPVLSVISGLSSNLATMQ